MKIHITSGTGTGLTKLSAFDAALNTAGVANFNLLRLSSVIPPSSKLEVHESLGGNENFNVDGQWGDRLYVVMAETREDVEGQEAWAGIGWVQDAQTGRGLFVEHEGKTEDEVKQEISMSLRQLVQTRGMNFGPIGMKIVGCRCKGLPVCALVVAIYETEGWIGDEARSI